MFVSFTTVQSRSDSVCLHLPFSREHRSPKADSPALRRLHLATFSENRNHHQDTRSNIVVLGLSLTVLRTGTTGELLAQAPGTTGHDHLSEVACVDVPPGEKRPEFGCFNVGTVKELQFPQSAVYWHLRAFGSRRLPKRPGVRPESSWRKTAACGSRSSGRATPLRVEVKLSPSSGRCSFQ